MSIGEAKPCPRCQQTFKCKAVSIAQCECNLVFLTEEEKAFIAQRYDDCLCLACLKDLKNKYIFFKEKYFGI